MNLLIDAGKPFEAEQIARRLIKRYEHEIKQPSEVVQLEFNRATLAVSLLKQGKRPQAEEQIERLLSWMKTVANFDLSVIPCQRELLFLAKYEKEKGRKQQCRQFAQFILDKSQENFLELEVLREAKSLAQS